MVSKMSSLAQKRVVVPVSSVGSPFSSGPVGHAHLEGLEPVVPVALDLDLDALGERVDHGDADAVQAAGDLVAAATELAAGVQHGEHDRDRGELLARRDVDRDAATVVGDLDAAVGEDRHLDAVAVAGQRLVDGVVHDLPHQVVQAALAGGADVHARALAHRLEALEDLDRAGVVGAGLDRVALENAGRDHVRERGAGPGWLDWSAATAAGLGRTLRRWSRRPRSSSSAVRPRARSARTGVLATQWPPHGWVGDQCSVYPSAPHNHVCCPGFGGIRPENRLSEARNRPGQPVLGGRPSPHTAVGAFRAFWAPPAAASPVGVPGAASLDPQAALASTTEPVVRRRR